MYCKCLKSYINNLYIHKFTLTLVNRYITQTMKPVEQDEMFPESASFWEAEEVVLLIMGIFVDVYLNKI